MSLDILITGVGGQGQVLASRLIAAAAINDGKFVRTGATIGMSQRGGCVVSHIRIGDSCKSATIPLGSADLIIGFELCETARILNRLKKDGKILLNNQIINPITVSLGMEAYDAQAMERAIEKAASSLITVDGYALAEEAGSVKAVNVVLLGAAVGSGYLPLSRESFQKALTENIPPRFQELNQKAFEAGYAYAAKALSLK